MRQLNDFADSVAVVVSSCDAFFDAWRPFAFFFRKFWSDCPFQVFLVVNELPVTSHSIQPIAVGPDQGWATNMQRALQELRTPYLLYFQEDYFLTQPVNRKQLADDFSYAMERDAASFCFYGRSRLEPEFEHLNDRFGIVPQNSDGRTRLQATLWKRDVFASILRPNETAWNMEARGSERTRGLLALSYSGKDRGPIPYLMSAITRGLWTPEALAMCEENQFRIQPHFRLRYTPAKWGRRFRRAVGRVNFGLARARQGKQPVDLDQIP